MRHPRRWVMPLALLWVAASGRGLGAGEVDHPWFRGALVGMEVGPTGAQSGGDPADLGYASKFDGREIVRRCDEAEGDYAVIWARDGEWAYYDSKVMPKCPGLGARDVLREAVEEGRARTLPIIAYCVVQQGGRFLEQHPELAMRGVDGALLPRYCLNSGTLDVLKSLTAEMLAYGIAGFHIDMLDQGFGAPYGCWCDACKAKFRARYDRPMPAGVSWDADWDRMLEFRYRSSQDFEKALRDHIRAVGPKATVDFNYHGNPPFSWEVGQRPVQHAVNGDFVTGETGVWAFGALAVGLNAEFYRAATPGQPFQVAIQRGVRMYHDQTTRPLDDIRWETMTLLAHGAFVTMVDKTAYDGTLDPVAYRRIGEAFREAHAKRAHLAGLPISDVAIYFSSRTRDWSGRADPSRYFQGFQGAHKAMALGHIPWSVALDENATAESLAPIPVVLLPNAEILSDREVAMFRRYVEGGGGLIVTGGTGLLDAHGGPLAASALESLIGAKFVRRLDSRDNHVRLPSRGADADAMIERLGAGIDRDWTFLVEGPAVVYEPRGATPVGELFRPHRTLRQRQGKEGTDWPMSADAPVGPAILVHEVGKGRVVTFAASPDVATASEHRLVEDRRLLANAVRLLVPHPRVRVEAPAFVEAVATADEASKAVRVHFLAYASTPMEAPIKTRPLVLPGLIEDAPMYRARITLGRPLKGVEAANPGTTLRIEGDAAIVVIDDIHEVITLHH